MKGAEKQLRPMACKYFASLHHSMMMTPDYAKKLKKEMCLVKEWNCFNLLDSAADCVYRLGSSSFPIGSSIILEPQDQEIG